jgi:hypothetical protein
MLPRKSGWGLIFCFLYSLISTNKVGEQGSCDDQAALELSTDGHFALTSR